MDIVLQIGELMYDVGFIILTILIVLYARKTYLNQQKLPSRLVARINYCFLEKDASSIPVVLDILNTGDYVAEKVKIQLVVKHNQPLDCDCIEFIAPKENFRYYLGTLTNQKITLFMGKSIQLSDAMDYDFFDVAIEAETVKLTVRGNWSE